MHDNLKKKYFVLFYRTFESMHKEFPTKNTIIISHLFMYGRVALISRSIWVGLNSGI